MLQKELFALLGWGEAKTEAARNEWSGSEMASGDTIEVSTELSGARLNVLSWRKNRDTGARQETLRAIFEPIKQGSIEWELLAARVNGIPCPLKETEAVALFEAARAVARGLKR